MRRGEAPTAGVIGGGVAGLAIACLLAGRGFRVTVYERGVPGGKLARMPLGDGTVDTGPSLFTFPDVWRRFLARLGEPGDRLPLVALPGLGLHVGPAGRVELPVPREDPLFAHWDRYVREVAPLRPVIADLLTLPPRPLDARFARASAALGRVIGPHLTAQSWLAARRFPRALHDALAVHTLNAGVGPRSGSALYALLPGLIAHDVHRPAGGMFALVECLVALASARGAEFRTQGEVLQVDLPRARVVTADGAARHDLLVSAVAPARLARMSGRLSVAGRRTVSGTAIYSRVPAPALGPTTVVLPGDMSAFEQAMNARALPRDTMALVHAGEDEVAVLLTAPASGRPLDLRHPWVRGQLERLGRLVGLPELDPSVTLTLTPEHFGRGGAPGGAIYGRVFPVWRAGPAHPEPYRLAPRVWQVGTGVHPGGGLPAVLGGALIVDELIGRSGQN